MNLCQDLFKGKREHMDRRLLVVIDDEEDILDLLEYNFIRGGFEVEVFNRARPALDYIRDHRPAMILCDWMMPEMDGLELCKRLKSDVHFCDIPFVMVTCRQESEAYRQALAAGVTDFIVKPVHIHELMGRVNQLLQKAV
ncbi:MAG: response regulator [Bacteroidetes bacterium]|nr:MAG: response regulator [Bacteroidota bacterium]